MKKVWCLLVVLLMLSTLTISYAVSNFSDVDGTKYVTAVETLTNKQIINGFEDGTFRPYQTVTRAQLAKMLVTALNLKVKSTRETRKHFNDVTSAHWAYNYVLVATDNNVINGYEDNSFRPENPVSYAESMAMIIRAIDYEYKMTKRDWPTSYVEAARILGLDKNIDNKEANSEALRGDISIAIYNALNVVEQGTYSNSAIELGYDTPIEPDVTPTKDNPTNNNEVVNPNATEVNNSNDYNYKVLSSISGIAGKNSLLFENDYVKYEVNSLYGNTDFSTEDLLELEGKLLVFTNNNNLINIVSSFDSFRIGNSYIVKSYNGRKVEFESEPEIDFIQESSTYSNMNALLVSVGVSFDNSVKISKISSLGKGTDRINLNAEDRLLIDDGFNTIYVIRGLKKNDNIIKGYLASVSLDKSFGIVENSYSNKVKINGKEFIVTKNDFYEGAFAIYSTEVDKKTSDDISLVTQVLPKVVDDSTSIVVESATGKAIYKNDSEINFDSSKNVDKYKDYVCAEINAKVKNNYVEFINVSNINSMRTYSFQEGSRVYISDSDKLILVIRGLDKLDNFICGVFSSHEEE